MFIIHYSDSGKIILTFRYVVAVLCLNQHVCVVYCLSAWGIFEWSSHHLLKACLVKSTTVGAALSQSWVSLAFLVGQCANPVDDVCFVPPVPVLALKLRHLNNLKVVYLFIFFRDTLMLFSVSLFPHESRLYLWWLIPRGYDAADSTEHWLLQNGSKFTSELIIAQLFLFFAFNCISMQP